MGQVANGMADGQKTYSLKVHIEYDVSNREWRGKERNHVPPEGAERERQSQT